ncbi:hypothetical protein TYRP_009272, partial [Tyrophagus putrescentiae]
AGFEEKGKEKVADRWRRVLDGNPSPPFSEALCHILSILIRVHWLSK